MPLRLLALAAALLCAAPASARADEPTEPAEPTPSPRFSLGGGAGYPQIFHADASLFLIRQVSVDTRVWSQALLPTKGIDGTLSIHVGPFASWTGILSGGVGVWREIPDRGGVLAEDPENSRYVRAAAGAGYTNRLIDLRMLVGATTRPSGESITVNVVVMRRWP